MIFDIIYNVIISPIEMIIEFIFSIIYKNIQNPGIAIIGVSLVVNFLVLPLYKKSDDLSEAERNKQKEMKPWLDHIKKSFKGDERYMMTQIYYRQQNYKPIYALRSSFSLLLQIPFFIAAYHYLSNLELLNGISFLCFSNLGQPDGLLKIGDLSINILPIIMTLINVISGAIYLKGLPIRDKIQTYGIAAIFLVLLYNSPSGLVFYWTLNQVFSVCKNIVMKLLPKREKKPKKEIAPIKVKYFFVGTIALTLFVGFVVPLSTIISSPQEFVGISHGPTYLAVNTLSVFAGLFILWLSIFYYLSNNRLRNIFTCAVWGLLGVAITNFFFFGKNYGNISASLIFDNDPAADIKTKLINLAIIIAVFVFFAFIVKKLKKISMAIGSIAIMMFIGLSIYNISIVEDSMSEFTNNLYKENATEVTSVFDLSRNGKNVIVFMLDRFSGGYADKVFDEHPEVKEKFSDFTYYRNISSFAGYTNFCTPSLFGGYDYTPVNINARSDESLKDKHNEAIQVMPRIFNENNYRMTIADIPYATKYEWLTDMSIYDKYENSSNHIIEGKYTTYLYMDQAKKYDSIQERNIIYFSIFKCAPVALQERIYDKGNYLSDGSKTIPNIDFLDAWSELKLMKELTKINDTHENSFIMMQNPSTHEPSRLGDNFDVSDTIVPEKFNNIEGEYMVHVGSLKLLGDYLDWLKEEGVFDNTRIIIVGDHGTASEMNPSMLLDNEIGDAEAFRPGLLVKDFNQNEFEESNKYMTIADVPVLATNDLISNPINPFTGNPITSDYKNSSEGTIITTSLNYSTTYNRGNTFDTSDGVWFRIKNQNIFDLSNYEIIGKEYSK